MYSLNFFRKSTNFNLWKHLIQALLSPTGLLCSLVWCDLSNKLESKLKVVANSEIRYIYCVWKREHISSYRTALHWLTAKGRWNYFTAVLMYRMFKSGKPEYVVKCDVINLPVRGFRTPLCIRPFRKKFLENSFHVFLSYLWKFSPSSSQELHHGQIFQEMPTRLSSLFAEWVGAPTARSPIACMTFLWKPSDLRPIGHMNLI